MSTSGDWVPKLAGKPILRCEFCQHCTRSNDPSRPKWKFVCKKHDMEVVDRESESPWRIRPTVYRDLNGHACLKFIYNPERTKDPFSSRANLRKMMSERDWRGRVKQ